MYYTLTYIVRHVLVFTCIAPVLTNHFRYKETVLKKHNRKLSRGPIVEIPGKDTGDDVHDKTPDVSVGATAPAVHELFGHLSKVNSLLKPRKYANVFLVSFRVHLQYVYFVFVPPHVRFFNVLPHLELETDHIHQRGQEAKEYVH